MRDWPASGTRLMSPVVQQTLCPFAQKARLWSAPPYDPDLSLPDNLKNTVRSVTHFARAAERHMLDGLACRLPVEAVGFTVKDLGVLMRMLIEILMAGDPENPRNFDRAEIIAPGWRFNFAGMDFFAPVFAPVYGPDHSRHAYGIYDSVFVLLQPDSSFHAHLGPCPDRIRENIRARFEKAGQPYQRSDMEAHKFVLPVNPQDGPVRWYDFEVPLSRATTNGHSARHE